MFSGARSRLVIRAFSSSPQAEFEFLRPFKGHKLTPPPSKLVATKDELLGYYKEMSLFRRLETACDGLYKERKIRGFLHMYDGQEACVSGMEAALKKTDSVITAYRDHCHQLGRGDTPVSVFSELLGKATGCSKGKGGSMHLYFPQNNFYGGNGIVGAQVPVGVGIAFAHKYKKDLGVCVAAFGDGAANQGQIYEALNMAALWKLPCIFVVENNMYGMGTSATRAAANPQFYQRGDYVPGLWVDGMDVLAVKAGFLFAAEWCRSGKGPLWVELHTYRYSGHSVSDPATSYRTRDEVLQVRGERDCIGLVASRLIQQGWATEAELKAITRATAKEVEKAAAEGEKAPQPPLSDTYVDIYAGSTPPFIRGVDPKNSFNVGLKYPPVV